MIRTVLIDDEPPARRKLRHLLNEEADISIVGEAGSGAEAVELLRDLKPDLAFLDVQLPDSTGFEVIQSLETGNGIHVVFVTAYDNFALRAFEFHALDYLLKPFEPSRLATAVGRARQAVGAGKADQLVSRLEDLVTNLRSSQTYVRRVLIQENERSLFLDVERIDWVEAARNYVCIHSEGRTYVTRSSLDSLAAKLDPSLFRRISRSELVNVNRIAEVRPWFHGDGKIRLKDGTELNWSRRYRSGSLEELERA